MSWVYARAAFFTCDGCGAEDDGFVGRPPKGWVEVDDGEALRHYCPACPEKKVLAPVVPKALH